jgi:hypothetical protein
MRIAVYRDKKWLRSRLPCWIFLFLVSAFFFPAEAKANHCPRDNPHCPPKDPGPHPSADRGWMWACRVGTDGSHMNCYGVYKEVCNCDPDSPTTRPDFQDAQMLLEKAEQCEEADGYATLVPNAGNAGVSRWSGVECELPTGQKWFESHPTTDICINRILSGKDPAELAENQGRNYCPY